MRLAYLGTPAAAVVPLRALVAAGHDVALVVSRADARRGRGSVTSPSPVKAAAQALGLPVTERVADLVELDPVPELGVVVAFGRLIRPPVLAVVPMVNLHFSLLPRWRGAAPVERAILAGDEVTGVCVMAVEEGLDTGGVHRRIEVVIGPDETAEELRGRLVEAGTAALVDALGGGLGPAVRQEGEPTYAAKLTPDELRLDWDGSVVAVHRAVRVGGAWTTVGGRRLKVHRTAVPPTGAVDGVVVPAGDGSVELLEVQPEGRGRMTAGAWARGAHVAPGTRLDP
ncbi:MAG: methionyl-tRNA formyltransferase [Acidimicrobiia bacterium]|nr:methionyl-tRNA formyltransferase [Acidimicrobiia bacterium]